MIESLSYPATVPRGASTGNAPGSLWRGPLLLLFAWGVVTSAFASGTVNARLLLDGMVSFWFVPVVQVLALALVVARQRPRPPLPFSRLVDLFFAGMWPWLLWMAAQAAIFSTVPRETAWWLGALNLSAAIPAALSLRIDVRFFQRVVGRTRHGAVIDVVGQRAIAWTLGMLYFYGIAIYSLGRSWLMLQGWL
jgi:hypothetical protein